MISWVLDFDEETQIEGNHGVRTHEIFWVEMIINDVALCFRKSLLVAVVLITLSVCCSAQEKLTQECIKKYLSLRRIDEDLLSYVDPYAGSLTDCESAVKSKLADHYSNLRNRLSGNRENRPFVECTMRDIEEEGDDTYEHLIVREFGVEKISNWRFWSYWSRESRLDDLKAASKNIVDKSLLKCKGNRQFGDLFSNIQEGSVHWERSGEEEYCIRRYLVNKTLISQSLPGFSANPKNVRTENLNCDPVVDLVVEKEYKSLQDGNASNCVINVYRANNYTDYILKAEVLARVFANRNEHEIKSHRSREKQDFINAMVGITYDARKC